VFSLDSFLSELFSGSFVLVEGSELFSLSGSLDVLPSFPASSLVHESDSLSVVVAAAAQAAAAVQAAGAIHNQAKAFHHNLLQILSFFSSLVLSSVVSA
jgi:hypothetical protein